MEPGGKTGRGTGHSLCRESQQSLQLVVASAKRRLGGTHGAGRQHVFAPHNARPVDQRRRFGGGKAQLKASVGPLSVVMGDVVEEDHFEVAAAEDEQVVRTFSSRRPHPTLRESVRPRGLDWALGHAGTRGSEDRVEGSRELRVAASDQELNLKTPPRSGELAAHPRERPPDLRRL